MRFRAVLFDLWGTLAHSFPGLQCEEALRAMAQAVGVHCEEFSPCWNHDPIARLIDVPIFSCRTGTKKPDPALYRLACSQLGIALSECVYVADGYSRELAGAAAMGMCAVLIVPPDEMPTDTSEWEGATWTGLRVANLLDVCELLGKESVAEASVLTFKKI